MTDTDGTSPVPQARVQHSIRSFFQPRAPSYTPPPSQATRQPQPSPVSDSTCAKPKLASPQSSTSTPSPSLPIEANISPVAEHHIQPLRRINSLLLPIAYPDAFYKAITTPSSPPNFSRIISWTDPSSNETKVVGGIVCRLDAPPSTPNTFEIYIQSLALLSPYRGRGLATAVLDDVVKAATQVEGVRIESIYAHVWTKNEEGLEWYAKRGFSKDGEPLAGYYRRLKPDSASVLRRRIQPSDHLQNMPTPQVTKTESVPSPVEAVMPPITHTRSFQDKGPEREWNDLPEDMGNGLLKPSGSLLGTPSQSSAASSRSSSRSGNAGKKKRVYPPAAFSS